MATHSNDGISIRWLGIALIVLALDQWTKLVILRTFTFGEVVPVTAFFNLVLVYNLGAAFSFLAEAGGWQRWFFIIISVAAAFLMIHLLRKHRRKTLFCLALSLILGGALGNLMDRLLHGHVIDFLDFHLHGWHWPAFNLADSAISSGAMLLIVEELRRIRLR